MFVLKILCHNLLITNRPKVNTQHVLLFELKIIVCKVLFEFTIIVNLEHCSPGHFRKEEIKKKQSYYLDRI